jgi:hypothetical protein
MPCKLNLNQIARRITWKTYAGAASTTIGSNYNYAYTISDGPDDNHFWEVLFASVVILGGSGTAINRAGLWLLQPGKQPASNSVGYHSDAFFAGNTTAANNGPPVGNNAIRVDEMTDNDVDDGYNVNSEITMIRKRPLFVPPKCILLAYGGGYGNGQGGVLGEQFQLNIAYVQGAIGTDDGDVAY